MNTILLKGVKVYLFLYIPTTCDLRFVCAAKHLRAANFSHNNAPSIKYHRLKQLIWTFQKYFESILNIDVKSIAPMVFKASDIETICGFWSCIKILRSIPILRWLEAWSRMLKIMKMDCSNWIDEGLLSSHCC